MAVVVRVEVAVAVDTTCGSSSSGGASSSSRAHTVHAQPGHRQPVSINMLMNLTQGQVSHESNSKTISQCET